SVASKVISTEKSLDYNKILLQYNLSKKEIDIIKLVANGLSNKEISEELYLSEGTIKNNITITIFDINQALKINEILSRSNKKVKVHIKIDTGFNRIGFKVRKG
ncbi:MAG: LuxR C-terminal-related transcriptional regulator, partial [Peptostreptococcaceae bacterium]